MSNFSIRIRPHVQVELDAAHTAERRGEFNTASIKLARAHVLGQASTREHVRVHWHMLRFAIRHRRTPEFFGQAWRLVAATVFTPLGMVPAGNTGRADVSGFKRMGMPEDLRSIIEAARG
ncbi:MAG TPA: DUF3703 domain-containing protein [Ramlibacter sp.]|nr:DUF3703 domain-containing protein [Ramlibacter sp.]